MPAVSTIIAFLHIYRAIHSDIHGIPHVENVASKIKKKKLILHHTPYWVTKL